MPDTVAPFTTTTQALPPVPVRVVQRGYRCPICNRLNYACTTEEHEA